MSGSGGTTGLEAPAELMAELGGGRRYPVIVAVGGHRYHSTVSWYQGAYMIPLSAENRAAAGVAAGDEVTVIVTADTEPRDVALPDDLDEVIDAEGRSFFASLPPSAKKAYVTWIDAAKKAETRATRIATAVQMLREHRRR